MLTICLNFGKKLSKLVTTLKKIIVGGTENGTVFRTLVDLFRIASILLEVEVFLLLVLEREIDLISGQYFGICGGVFLIVLPITASLLIRKLRGAVGLILEVTGWDHILPFCVTALVRRRSIVFPMLVLSWSVLLRPGASLFLAVLAHIPASFSGLSESLHFLIEVF